MKSVKIIFIAGEIVMLAAFVFILFASDWRNMPSEQYDLCRILVALCGLTAIAFQKEQQAIDWDESEE